MSLPSLFPSPARWALGAVLLFGTPAAIAAPPEAVPQPGLDTDVAAEGTENTAAPELPAELKALARQHFSPEQREHFEKMSPDEVATLMGLADDAKVSELEGEIRESLGRAAFELDLNYQTGDVVVGENLATLRLGSEFRYLDDANTQKVLVQAWGNPPGGTTLGMIVPTDTSPLHTERGWAVIVSYTEEGYVDDDDAKDIDYDELLEEMQEGTVEENKARKEAGFESIELVGWAESPRYDADSHRLYWAKHLKFEGAEADTLNYAIRVLGRKGVLELNAVASMSQLDQIRRDMGKVLPRAEFNDGQRYADFNPDFDEVAAYGIGGLIAGKALAKVGLFAGFFKILLAAKKLLILLVVGGGAMAVKLFKGRSE